MLSKSDFFTKYYQYAYQSGIKSKISPLVILTQAFLESGGAKSLLASKYNNFFGVKADKAWKGKKIRLNTREVIQGKSVIIPQDFRWYDSPEQSFTDHAQFLLKNPRYAKSGLLNPNNTPQMQIDSIAKAGYATDPNYAKVLKDVLSNFNSIKDKLVKENKLPSNGGVAISLIIPVIFLLGYLIYK